MPDFHTAVVGAGSGGLTVAIGLARLGRRVALIEGGPVGGDCTNVGCIPSKTLIHLARQGMEGRAALAEVRRKRDALRDRETEELGQTPHLTLIQGWARLEGPGRLSVDGRSITAGRIVLATGSRPRELEIEGLPAERKLTNRNLFELDAPPEHLVIVGGGVIALEMAFAFRRLGSRVSLLVRSGRLRLPDEADVVMRQALAARDIELVGGVPRRYAGGNLHTDGAILDGVDRVLLALGRLPNLEELNLSSVGLTPATFRPLPGLYAVGDITPTSHFTHSANAQGRQLLPRLVLPWWPRRPEPPFPQAIFSEPEVAMVGLRHRVPPGRVKRLRVELASLDRGYTDGLERGFLAVEAERLTGRLLSATLVAPAASEMLSFLTLAMSERISLYRLQKLVYPYPTLSGGLQKLADDFVLGTLRSLPRELWATLRGG